MKKIMTDKEIKEYALQMAIEDVFSSRGRDEEGEAGEYTDDELLALLDARFIDDFSVLLYEMYEGYNGLELEDVIKGKSQEYERLMKLGRDGRDENAA